MLHAAAVTRPAVRFTFGSIQLLLDFGSGYPRGFLTLLHIVDERRDRYQLICHLLSRGLVADRCDRTAESHQALVHAASLGSLSLCLLKRNEVEEARASCLVLGDVRLLRRQWQNNQGD